MKRKGLQASSMAKMNEQWPKAEMDLCHVMRWVPVSESLPPRGGRYLVHAPSDDPEKPLITVALWNPRFGDWSTLPEAWSQAVTHWMELPPAPEKTP